MKACACIRLAIGLAGLVAAAGLGGCAPYAMIDHTDYGDCRRADRHTHNDHVFLGDYHDHALCEWLEYE